MYFVCIKFREIHKPVQGDTQRRIRGEGARTFSSPFFYRTKLPQHWSKLQKYQYLTLKALSHLQCQSPIYPQKTIERISDSLFKFMFFFHRTPLFNYGSAPANDADMPIRYMVLCTTSIHNILCRSIRVGHTCNSDYGLPSIAMMCRKQHKELFSYSIPAVLRDINVDTLISALHVPRQGRH